MTKTKTVTPTEVKPMAPDGSIVFNFSVSAAEVAEGYQEVLSEYAATAEIKGFRKGKAPIAMVEASLDKPKVYSHVLEHILPHAYGDFLDKHGFKPLIDPRLTPVSMEEGKDWEFKAETAGRPEITLGDYKKYVAEALKKAPKDAKTSEDKQMDAKLTVALDTLLKNAKIAVAPLLIEEETKTALGKLVNQLSSLKLSLEDYVKSIKKTQEELIAEYRTTAETNLKVEFLVSEVAHDLAPDINEKDPYKKYAAERRFALDFLSGL